jgi:hypothetical protein
MRFLKSKQGVEMTLQTVIIAVLVLIVLVVLLYIFLKGSTGFILGVSGCEDRHGSCVSDSQSCTSSGGSVYRLGKCDNDMVCCIYESNLLNEDKNE